METKLLLALFFCHFICDYTHLSTAWMLNAKRLGTPALPIFIHALVHATVMFICLIIFRHYYGREVISVLICVQLFLFQLCSHFLIDLWKGKMNVWFPSLQPPANKWHWIVFGADQYFHTAIIILMVHLIK